MLLPDKPKLLIICGPTASGKSKFGMDIATQNNGEIVNIDAMQVYKEIPILTCSPAMEDKSLVPHHLYNHISVASVYNASLYIEESVKSIRQITQRGLMPIILGGTGLYIKALCDGMSQIPDIPTELRESVRKLFEQIGREEFYTKLSQLDPVASSNLHPANTQRLMRAYEVVVHTGKSIYEFYESPTESPLKEYDIKTIILMPDREELYARCDRRFLELMEIGAVEEVEALMQNIDIDCTKVKAIGFDEIFRYLSGTMTKDEAIKIAQAKTRQYAKRQTTWFKHQISGGIITSSSYGLTIGSTIKKWILGSELDDDNSGE